ncbi:MAG: ATP-binding cassette domain-containing protein [Bacilli bacterium]|nr:ATP-binding cassette domain-containing protein [Bacilli bacterium]
MAKTVRNSKKSIKNVVDIYEHAPSLKKIKKEDIAIELSHLTKDYGKGRGLFDVSFIVPKGKTFGYCGTNGAGKTTTLRHIMGFLKPDSGYVKVYGMDAWKNSTEIKKFIGYLPGEIAFPQLETGSDFLKVQAEMLEVTDMSRAEEIINALQLDPTANLKRMSKGMKQKTALVAAFMHHPEIILLDEPTTGLDPLMRESFINIIKQEKERGATIIMSNHMFDELEETCDYVGFIKDGHLVDIVDMNQIHERPFREFIVSLKDKKSFEKVDASQVKVLTKDEEHFTYIVRVENEKIDGMFRELNKVNVKLIKEVQYTLEKYFMENVIGGMKDE